MNKISCLILVFSIAFSSNVFAQKIKNEKAVVRYTQLPSSPMDGSFTTYSNIVYGSTSGIEDLGYDRESLANSYLTVDGYKRLNAGGHFRISSYVGYPRLVSSELKSEVKTETVNEKKVKRTYYHIAVVYRVPVTYKVEDYQGNILSSGSFSENASFNHGNSRSSSSVRSDWYDRKNGILHSKYKGAVAGKLKKVASAVRNKYAYSPKKSTVQFEVLGKKDDKAPEFMKNFEIVRDAFATMKADENLDAVKTAVKPAIDFYTSEKNKWSASDKKEKKVRSACVYNLAKIYYWLDELDEAKKYANEIIEIDYKIGRGKTINRSIDSVKKLFEKNNTTSRHPYFDLESATPPNSASFGGLEEPEDEGPAAAAVTELAGSMTDKAGTVVDGKFAVTAGEGEELTFGPKGNVSFSYEKDGRAASSTLVPTEMSAFKLNDRNFVVSDFVAGAKGNTESKPSILELLYDGGTIKVFKYYPYDDALGDKDVEYAFQKEGETSPTSTSSTTFLLFNKGLQKYFTDCADLAEVAGTGEFKKNEDDIIRAARVYAEMCKAP